MSRTVLIVEDDADIRDALSVVVEDAGIVAAQAANGLEGLHLIERLGPPCLILLDWWLPVLSGHEFLACLRAGPDTHSVPVVVMTGSESEPPVGVAAFLRKPFGIAPLMALLARYCSERCAPSTWMGTLH